MLTKYGYDNAIPMLLIGFSFIFFAIFSLLSKQPVSKLYMDFIVYIFIHRNVCF